jgi:DNA-binding NarL/FixJ family response regulator
MAPLAQKKPIRILLIDDHEIIRDGLRNLINTHPEMVVVGDAGNSADALRLAAREQPDVIVLDLHLDKESGLDLLPELLNTVKDTSIIVLTGAHDPAERDRAMELGAKGMVLKEKGAVELLSAIEKVHYTGEFWFEPGAAQRWLGKRRRQLIAEDDPEKIKIARLTPIEREIIVNIGKGLDNKQIAESMNMALSTARNNLSRIYDKLEIKGGRLELLVYAYRHGLVKPSH